MSVGLKYKKCYIKIKYKQIKNNLFLTELKYTSIHDSFESNWEKSFKFYCEKLSFSVIVKLVFLCCYHNFVAVNLSIWLSWSNRQGTKPSISTNPKNVFLQKKVQ